MNTVTYIDVIAQNLGYTIMFIGGVLVTAGMIFLAYSVARTCIQSTFRRERFLESRVRDLENQLEEERQLRHVVG